MAYDPTDERWREYHVTPRYLAGATSTGDLALRPLLDQGWNLTHDEPGNVYVAAPDHRVRLGYLPEGDDDALWKITAYSDSRPVIPASRPPSAPQRPQASEPGR